MEWSEVPSGRQLALTINRTLIEVALDDPHADESLQQLGANLLAVNERHERLIDGLLTLASSEQGVTDQVPVDLADIARHVTTESQAAAQAAGIDVRTEFFLRRLRVIQSCWSDSPRTCSNAIRYMAERGEITVTTDTADNDALLTVENTGSPVPIYEIPSLFEPFVGCQPRNDAPTRSVVKRAEERGWDCPTCGDSSALTRATSTPQPAKTEAHSEGTDNCSARNVDFERARLT